MFHGEILCRGSHAFDPTVAYSAGQELCWRPMGCHDSYVVAQPWHLPDASRNSGSRGKTCSFPPRFQKTRPSKNIPGGWKTLKHYLRVVAQPKWFVLRCKRIAEAHAVR